MNYFHFTGWLFQGKHFIYNWHGNTSVISISWGQHRGMTGMFRHGGFLNHFNSLCIFLPIPVQQFRGKNRARIKEKFTKVPNNILFLLWSQWKQDKVCWSLTSQNQDWINGKVTNGFSFPLHSTTAHHKIIHRQEETNSSAVFQLLLEWHWEVICPKILKFSFFSDCTLTVFCFVPEK